MEGKISFMCINFIYTHILCVCVYVSECVCVRTHGYLILP